VEKNKITSENLPDILKVQGINAAGYGIIPKLAMIDQRITPTAKLIYAYFCSYAGAGNIAFPSQSKIRYDLKIKDPDTFRKHLNYLKTYGYVLVEQEQGEKGRFSHNVYTLVANPVEIICSEQSKPLPKKPVTEKIRNGKNPSPKKPTTIINSSFKTNNSFKINNNSKRENKEDVVVSPEAQIIIENFKTLYNADLIPKYTQKMIDAKGIEVVTQYLNEYTDYIQDRNIGGLGADFYKCVMDGYTKPTPKKSPSTVASYANFDQRDYNEEDLKKFYANLND
jgi:hypothetical protein